MTDELLQQLTLLGQIILAGTAIFTLGFALAYAIGGKAFREQVREEW